MRRVYRYLAECVEAVPEPVFISICMTIGILSMVNVFVQLVIL